MADGGDGAPIKLDRRTNAIGAVSKYHDPSSIVSNIRCRDVALTAVVGHVKIVRLGGKLSCESVDLLADGCHSQLLALATHDQLSAVEVPRNLTVRETSS